MCVIAYQPKGERLDKELAEAMWKRNPDGGGFAFFTDSGIRIEKSMNWNEWWARYTNFVAQYGADSPFLIHMRIATHGTTDIDNVHPFRVNENTVMAHNGIISATVSYDQKETRSDTRMFIDEVIPHLSKNWLDQEYVVNTIQDGIGNSKLAFLTMDPDLEHPVYILNAHKGSWIEGWWFSNTYGLTNTEWMKANRKQPVSWKSSSNNKKNNNKKTTTNNAIIRPLQLESSSSWDEWLDKRQVLSEMDEIQLERRETGFNHHLRYDAFSGYIICSKCEYTVSLTDVTCRCYDMVCTVCGDFAAFCKCSPSVEQLTPIKDLDKKEVTLAWIMD